MKISNNMTTIALLLAVVVVSVQTYYLLNLSQKLAESEIGVGASPMQVNLIDDGSAPDMVGGC